MDDATIIERVLRDERAPAGRPEFTDRADDRGGPTKFGITVPALTDYRRARAPAAPPATRDDVAALTLEDAWRFYDWLLVDSGVAALTGALTRWVVFDCVVNHGRRPAWSMFQRAVGVTVDGVPGPVTYGAESRYHDSALAVCFLAERVEAIGRIVSGNYTDADHDGKPDAAENCAGWCARVKRQMVEVAS